MSEAPEITQGIVAELKRRKVVRAVLVYGASAFAVLQVADIVEGPLGLPEWVMPALIWAILLGLPAVIMGSWLIDLSRRDEGPARWMSWRAAVALVLLLGGGLATGWLARTQSGEQPPAAAIQAGDNVVAVLPFSVLGSPGLSYLSEAVARLLSTSLDGAAGLRSVSSHAVMGYSGLQASVPVSDHLAREVAAHFGAGIWIMGDVVEAGDSLRIEGSLFTASDLAADPVSVSVTGEIGDLFTSVDELAARLIAEREAGSGSERTRVAAITTSSIEALKAYIEGERAFRSGSYLPAIRAFTQAVEADPSFALAFYRLSMAEERLAWAEPSRRSAEAALQHSQRLSPRDRQLLESLVALRRGVTSHAEQMLRKQVRAYPDDAEAWYQLGEILFHGEPLRGGSMTAARESLERALFFDPGDLGALYHLARIAIKDRDAERLDRLTERFVALSPTGERTLELRALQSASQLDKLGFDSILEEMRGSPDTFLPIAVWSVATFGQDPAGAGAIARLMTGSDRPSEVRGAGHVQLGYLALAQGRYREALTQFDQAERLGDPDAAESRAWIATLPFVPGGEKEKEKALRQLKSEHPPGLESPRPSSFFSAHNGVHAIVRTYLRGLLIAAQGESELEAVVQELEAVGGTSGGRNLAAQLAVGVRASGALAQGDAAAALALLEALQIEGWYELTFVSPYYSGALERFTLAELLFEAGRLEEALGWYAGLGENSVAELVFTGPALLRQAAIHRRAGRGDSAQHMQKRFAALWSDADPGFRTMLEDRYDR